MYLALLLNQRASLPFTVAGTKLYCLASATSLKCFILTAVCLSVCMFVSVIAQKVMVNSY